MFEIQATSLGRLTEAEQEWALRYLEGDAWAVLFGDLEKGSHVPDWLVEWSKRWQREALLVIDDIDPYLAEYHLITDGSAGESWLGIRQGGNGNIVLQPIAMRGGEPDPDAVCTSVFRDLSGIGDYLLIGNISIRSPRWLPRQRMEPYLRARMLELNCPTLHGLTLQSWLNREYPAKKQVPNPRSGKLAEASNAGGCNSESFGALWSYCTEGNRLVPNPERWNQLFRKLKNVRKPENGGWEPHPPLILAAWHHSTTLEKQLRFKEHLLWADAQRQLDEIGGFLRSMPESDWCHLGEI